MNFAETVWLALPLFLSACTTITVGPASSTTDGFEYSLPRPMLVVTPDGKGSIKVETVLVPDPSRTYRIDARSYLSSHSMGITIRDGLLQKYSMSSDSTEVVSGALQNASELSKKLLELEGERRKKDKEKDDSAKANEDKEKSKPSTMPRPRIFLVEACRTSLALKEVLPPSPQDIIVLPRPSTDAEPDQWIRLDVNQAGSPDLSDVEEDDPGGATPPGGTPPERTPPGETPPDRNGGGR